MGFNEKKAVSGWRSSPNPKTQTGWGVAPWKLQQPIDNSKIAYKPIDNWSGSSFQGSRSGDDQPRGQEADNQGGRNGGGDYHQNGGSAQRRRDYDQYGRSYDDHSRGQEYDDLHYEQHQQGGRRDDHHGYDYHGYANEDHQKRSAGGDRHDFESRRGRRREECAEMRSLERSGEGRRQKKKSIRERVNDQELDELVEILEKAVLYPKIEESLRDFDLITYSTICGLLREIGKDKKGLAVGLKPRPRASQAPSLALESSRESSRGRYYPPSDHSSSRGTTSGSPRSSWDSYGGNQCNYTRRPPLEGTKYYTENEEMREKRRWGGG